MHRSNAFFAKDLYVLSAIHRSIKLNEAFLLLVENDNYDSAVPLLRLLLDSSLRIHALSMVKDPEMTAREVLGGKSLNKIRFNGKITLKDSELLKDIESHIPGIDKCYKSLSSFIHLSDTHFLTMFTQNKISIGGNSLGDNTDIRNQINTLHKELNTLLLQLLESYYQSESQP